MCRDLSEELSLLHFRKMVFDYYHLTKHSPIDNRLKPPEVTTAYCDSDL